MGQKLGGGFRVFRISIDRLCAASADVEHGVAGERGHGHPVPIVAVFAILSEHFAHQAVVDPGSLHGHGSFACGKSCAGDGKVGDQEVCGTAHPVAGLEHSIQGLDGGDEVGICPGKFAFESLVDLFRSGDLVDKLGEEELIVVDGIGGAPGKGNDAGRLNLGGKGFQLVHRGGRLPAIFFEDRLVVEEDHRLQFLRQAVEGTLYAAQVQCPGHEQIFPAELVGQIIQRHELIGEGKFRDKGGSVGRHDVRPGAGRERRTHRVHHIGLLFSDHLDGVALLVKTVYSHVDDAVGGYGSALPEGDLHLFRRAFFSGLLSTDGRAGRHKQTRNKQQQNQSLQACVH